MFHFCTYFDKNYLVRGLALVRSLTRHAEACALYVLCLDHVTRSALAELEFPGLHLITLEDFEQGDEDLQRAKRDRSLVEYYFTCTPSLVLYVLHHFPDVDVLTYLDADLFFFSDPAPIFDELGDRSVLICGHRFPPSLRHFETVGIYNVGLVAFRNDSTGRESLRWWRERCLEWCYDRTEDGRFADQKYLDDWPTRFSRVAVLQHKGAGLAPWNVAQYSIRERGGAVLIDEDPLVFYHFHRLRMLTPFLFDPGLDGWYDSDRFSDVLWHRVYAPYLWELRWATQRFRVRLASARRHERDGSSCKIAHVIPRGRLLLLVGPVVVRVHVRRLLRPLLRLADYPRRLLRRSEWSVLN